MASLEPLPAGRAQDLPPISRMVGRPHGSRRPLDQACTPSAGDGLPRSPASVNTDEWKRSPYPALMTAEQFEFVQQRLERNGRLSPRNPRRPSLLRAPCPPRGRLRLYRCSTRSKHRILREYCRCSRDRRSAPARRLCLRQPAGALCTWPKQWQSGERPRANALAIAALNASSNTPAPTAPNRADAPTISATPTSTSQIGNHTPVTPAHRAGTPKSATARRDPARSASFATPANTNTPASNTRHTRSAGPIARETIRTQPPTASRNVSWPRAVL